MRSIVLCVSSTLLIGCGSNDDSRFEWRNVSGHPVWVDACHGFKYSPQPGLLRGSKQRTGGKMFVLPPQEIPDTFTIVWWKGTREDKQSDPISSDVSIAHVPPEERDGVLTIQLERDDTWSARFRPLRDYER